MGNSYSSLPQPAKDGFLMGNYCIGLIYFMSPLPSIIRIYKKKTVKGFSALPHLAGLMYCLMGVIYGFCHTHRYGYINDPMNIFGGVAEACYVSVFLVFSPKQQRYRIILFVLVECAFFGSVAAILFLLVESHSYRSVVSGVFCVISGTLMHASPLQMWIQTNSIPIGLASVSSVYAISWTIFGALLSEPYLIIPNAIGSLIGIVQMVLHWYCPAFGEDRDEVEVEVDEEEGAVIQRVILSRDEVEVEVDEVDEEEGAVIQRDILSRDEVQVEVDEVDEEEGAVIQEFEDEDDVEEEVGVLTQRGNLSRARRARRLGSVRELEESTNLSRARRARRLGGSESEFTILIVFPESRRGQQFHCSPLVESGETIGTVITLRVE